jgi:glyoxylase-like metal-dependent hydrolase (beta-lactamase superfamily II)
MRLGVLMEIIEGIHRIDEASSNIAHSNVYLVIDGKELVVVDTGTSGNAKKIVAYIQKIGHQPSEVSTIVLTHYHMDHVGSAKELKDLTNAKVAVHIEDADFVSGKKPVPKPKNVLFRAVSSFIKPTPVEVDIELKDGDKLGSLKVIDVPGHTPGSIALLDIQRKALFVGDTLRFDGSKITGAPKQFSWDADKEKNSIEKISLLEFDIMLPGHGEVLKDNASNAVKKFLDYDRKA